MKADIEVLVVSTPDEMNRAGESTYVVLERTVQLSAAPSVGFRVGLKPNLSSNDATGSRYAELMRQVSDNTGIFEIEEITDFPGSRLVVRGKEKYEPTAERFCAYIEFLTTYYGFTRSV